MATGVMRTSLIPRTTHTVGDLMDALQRKEIAQRIRDLRETSPFSQQVIADRLGITLRAYQKVEERGTTRWERVEELAQIYEVDPDSIWYGEERPVNEADVERKLDQILDRLDVLEAALRADALSERSATERPPSRRARRAARDS